MKENRLRVLVSRHSAFYSPLIAAISAGFLREEGLDASYGVLAQGQHLHDLIRNGEVDVGQAAVSSNWLPIERGEADLALHFAQINQRDGFFLTSRRPDPEFEWKKLEGKSLLADHGGQPFVMLKYALHCKGVDWRKVEMLDAGTPEEMDAAFRTGRGDYVHQQGPAPQQIEQAGLGFVVARVGEVMPPVAFSSLMASRGFLETGAARAFIRAFRKARLWVQQADAHETAEKEVEFFPGVPLDALAGAIQMYQSLGCWTGEAEISRELYDQALRVFLHSGAISHAHPFERVVVPPPV